MLSDIYFRLLLEIMGKDPKVTIIPKLIAEGVDRPVLNPVRNFYLLIESIYKQNPDSNIGLEFGRQVKPVNACDFTRLIITSQNVKSALQVLTDIYPSLNLKPFHMVHRDKKHLSLSLCYPYEKILSHQHKRFCSETFFSFLCNFLRELVSTEIKPKKVYLDYPRPSYADEYYKLFGCEVIFDAPLSMIIFDDEIASRNLNSANPFLHEVYMEKALESWQAMKRQQSFKYRTLTKLLMDFPNAFNSQYLAKSLNISTRGLQKRLSAEGCSFSNLSQQVRRELLKVCMFQRHYDLEEATRCLGFQTQVSLRKFFKQYMDTSPKRFEEIQQAILERVEAS